MLLQKYKYLKNHGLLPKIQHKELTNLTTFALINTSSPKEYHLKTIHQPDAEFFLFNDKEYMHRKCSHIFQTSTNTQILKKLADVYPKHDQTLTIFLVNDPKQSDGLILGHQCQTSMLSLIYKQMQSKKPINNKISLSIMGIQSENSLTDQLNYEWMDRKQKQTTETSSIQNIQTHKSKIKVVKSQNGGFRTENCIKQRISSQEHLGQILARYKELKTYFEQWILSTQFRQYYLLGQIYQLSEVQTNKVSLQQPLNHERIVSTHYILRINQYIRTTSPLMLRLSMTLKRWLHDVKPSQIPENKLFKLIYSCFLHKNSQHKFHLHLFLQVGQYNCFKQQYLCLVPISQFLISNPYNNDSIQDQPFFYTKQYTQYPEISSKITAIYQNKEGNQANGQSQEESFLNSFKKIYNRSYFNPTLSSIEKKNKKVSVLPSQVIMENCKESDLDELIHETIKIYRQPSPVIVVKKLDQPSNKISNLSRRKSVKINLLQKISNHPVKEQQTQLKKQKRVHTQNIHINDSKGQINKSLHRKSNKFYEQTKYWLDHVYGKNMHQSLQKTKKKVNEASAQQLLKKV